MPFIVRHSSFVIVDIYANCGYIHSHKKKTHQIITISGKKQKKSKKKKTKMKQKTKITQKQITINKQKRLCNPLLEYCRSIPVLSCLFSNNIRITHRFFNTLSHSHTLLLFVILYLFLIKKKKNLFEKNTSCLLLLFFYCY